MECGWIKMVRPNKMLSRYINGSLHRPHMKTAMVVLDAKQHRKHHAHL